MTRTHPISPMNWLERVGRPAALRRITARLPSEGLAPLAPVKPVVTVESLEIRWAISPVALARAQPSWGLRLAAQVERAAVRAWPARVHGGEGEMVSATPMVSVNLVMTAARGGVRARLELTGEQCASVEIAGSSRLAFRASSPVAGMELRHLDAPGLLRVTVLVDHRTVAPTRELLLASTPLLTGTLGLAGGVYSVPWLADAQAVGVIQ